MFEKILYSIRQSLNFSDNLRFTNSLYLESNSNLNLIQLKTLWNGTCTSIMASIIKQKKDEIVKKMDIVISRQLTNTVWKQEKFWKNSFWKKKNRH